MALKAIITGLVIAGVGVLVLSAPNGKSNSVQPLAAGIPAVSSTSAVGDSDCSACVIQPSAKAKAALASKKDKSDCVACPTTAAGVAKDGCCSEKATTTNVAAAGVQAEKDCSTVCPDSEKKSETAEVTPSKI